MKTIFFKQRADRKKEIVFFNLLQKQLGNNRHINENYLLSSSLLTNPIDVKKVIMALNKDKKLSSKKREKTIQALSILPNNVLVAKSIKDVSVDFVIQNEKYFRLIEFHEKQHFTIRF